MKTFLNQLRDPRYIGQEGMRDQAAFTIETLMAERDTLRKQLVSAKTALAPFAKAGELFRDRPDDSNNELVYGPAAGDEYNITGDHLRAARLAFTDEQQGEPK